VPRVSRPRQACCAGRKRAADTHGHCVVAPQDGSCAIDGILISFTREQTSTTSFFEATPDPPGEQGNQETRRRGGEQRHPARSPGTPPPHGNPSIQPVSSRCPHGRIVEGQSPERRREESVLVRQHCLASPVLGSVRILSVPEPVHGRSMTTSARESPHDDYRAAGTRSSHVRRLDGRPRVMWATANLQSSP
jgi:hypothetical protein